MPNTTIDYILPSGSAGGRQVKVAATATPGTLFHATGTSDAVIDLVTMYANNTSAAAVKLTVECGDVTSPDDLLEITIPQESGDVLILDRRALSGTGAAARNVRAFAGTANVINISGLIERVS